MLVTHLGSEVSKNNPEGFKIHFEKKINNLGLENQLSHNIEKSPHLLFVT